MSPTASSGPVTIEMTGLEKRFALRRGEQVHALGPVDLALTAGEFVAIVGPSGCGKSTLLRVGAGLLNPSAGSMRRTRGGASFVFQEPALLNWRTVAANCTLPLELTAVPRREWSERVRASLELVGMGEWSGAYPSQLSGGMKMRVSVARALVTDADVVHFDEPFAAIDELTREVLNVELSQVWAKRRFAALFVTHNVHEAVFLADRVLVMSPRPGRIVGEVTVPFAHPRPLELRTSGEFAAVVREVTALLRASSPAPAAAR